MHSVRLSESQRGPKISDVISAKRYFHVNLLRRILSTGFIRVMRDDKIELDDHDR